MFYIFTHGNSRVCVPCVSVGVRIDEDGSTYVLSLTNAEDWMKVSDIQVTTYLQSWLQTRKMPDRTDPPKAGEEGLK